MKLFGAVEAVLGLAVRCHFYCYLSWRAPKYRAFQMPTKNGVTGVMASTKQSYRLGRLQTQNRRGYMIFSETIHSFSAPCDGW